MSGYVYILASKRMGRTYVGVTNDIARRVWEHKNDRASKHTTHYKIYNLVWYQQYPSIEEAIAQEKRMKEWNRAWKIEAIEKMNPLWNDLYEALAG